MLTTRRRINCGQVNRDQRYRQQEKRSLPTFCGLANYPSLPPSRWNRGLTKGRAWPPHTPNPGGGDHNYVFYNGPCRPQVGNGRKAGPWGYLQSLRGRAIDSLAILGAMNGECRGGRQGPASTLSPLFRTLNPTTANEEPPTWARAVNSYQGNWRCCLSASIVAPKGGGAGT